MPPRSNRQSYSTRLRALKKRLKKLLLDGRDITDTEIKKADRFLSCHSGTTQKCVRNDVPDQDRYGETTPDIPEDLRERVRLIRYGCKSDSLKPKPEVAPLIPPLNLILVKNRSIFDEVVKYITAKAAEADAQGSAPNPGDINVPGPSNDAPYHTTATNSFAQMNPAAIPPIHAQSQARLPDMHLPAHGLSIEDAGMPFEEHPQLASCAEYDILLALASVDPAAQTPGQPYATAGEARPESRLFFTASERAPGIQYTSTVPDLAALNGWTPGPETAQVPEYIHAEQSGDYDPTQPWLRPWAGGSGSWGR